MEIPEFLYQKLKNQYNNEELNIIKQGYQIKRPVTLRINTIKSNKREIIDELNKAGVIYENVNWNENALILNNIEEYQIKGMDIYKNGKIYLQSLSSMIPVIILNPKPHENILDMTAAPGGKTTQISAMSNNEVLITACEKNKIRLDRLQYNIQKQGAKGVNLLNIDSRKLDDFFSFDKILLDAPCSGSGTININDEQFEKHFTEELINRSKKTQMELLNKAVSILKKGHEIVYSTCSILAEENEDNIYKLLKTNKVELVPIDNKIDIPLLHTKIPGTLIIAPTKYNEGFFVAKLRKK